ncbi:Polysaccharide deacetylase [Polystyrenella longa]|uniref:Polysaccharide deacetylase n=1 Tax=Polystyrenella longa TaxID=2528007 RepID=A0A518CNR1_9PLAN|nr:polysaccharide deacetylase family protein [Polystyrenella longa]QDU80862.1 Polysaccharide deacetylase [Polystyrenella longa]
MFPITSKINPLVSAEILRVNVVSLIARLAVCVMVIAVFTPPLLALEPIPDKLVVLTFDDSVKSHITVVRPILKKHGFGGTFYITEGFDFKENKESYLTWEEIAFLHRDGFEIGNHTRDHMGCTKKNLSKIKEQLDAINDRCAEYDIPKPTTFAYPGNAFDDGAIPILEEAGIQFARRGGSPEYSYQKDRGKGFGYEPGRDHPLLVPSAGDARPDWTLDDFKRAASMAKEGKIAILQFHGVPEVEHPWVHTPVVRFQEYMQYLKDEGYTVIAMRDLAKYVDPKTQRPDDLWEVISKRKAKLAKEKPTEEE